MKNKISGWKEIFSFTFSQSIKTKSIKITTIILCLIAICSMPIMSMVKGKDTEKKKTSIKKVLVLDATEWNLYNNINVLKETDLYKSNEKKIYTDITYDVAKIEAKDPNASLKDIYKFDKKANEVYMVLTYVKDQIGIQLLYSDKTSVKENDVNDYSAFVEEHFNKVLANNQNISEEQKKIATSKLSVKYYDKDEAAAIDKKADKKDTYAGSKNNIIYATLLIIMFVLSFGGERVAVSIIK